MDAEIDLSLVVPAFNEERRIGEPLRAMGEYLAGQSYRSEILVVDDGSTDDTTGVARRVARDLRVPVRLLGYASNRGKGHALKVGFAHARGRRILFSDSDLSTPIDETARFMAALDEGWDIAIGSRRLAGARIVVHQPWWRESMGAVFTGLVRLLIADVSDATCGFKAFDAAAGKDVFSYMRLDGWCFDAELLFLAKRRGYRLTEVPVRWHDESGTKVRLRRDVLDTLIGLARIRLLHLLGRYRTRARSASPLGARFLDEVVDGSEVEPS